MVLAAMGSVLGALADWGSIQRVNGLSCLVLFALMQCSHGGSWFDTASMLMGSNGLNSPMTLTKGVNISCTECSDIVR